MNTYLDLTCTRDITPEAPENHYYPYKFTFEGIQIERALGGTADDDSWVCYDADREYLGFLSQEDEGWVLYPIGNHITLWPNKLQALSYLALTRE